MNYYFSKNRIITLTKQFLLRNDEVLSHYRPSIPYRYADSRCAVSSDSGFAYFRIPKAANSTVMASIHAWQRGFAPRSAEELSLYKNSFSRPSGLNSLDSFRSLYKFTIVRNPYDRILSAYRDKVVRRKRESAYVLYRLGKGRDDNASLDEFLFYLSDLGGLFDDPHWMPQAGLAWVPRNELDFVGRVENLDADLSFLRDQFFLSRQELSSWLRDTTNNIPGAGLTPAQRKKVFSIYADDFEIFGYPA